MTQIIYSSKHPFYIDDVDERIKAVESIDIDDVKEWQSDVQSSMSNTTTTRKSTFLQRNKSN